MKLFLSLVVALLALVFLACCFSIWVAGWGRDK